MADDKIEPIDFGDDDSSNNTDVKVEQNEVTETTPKSSRTVIKRTERKGKNTLNDPETFKNRRRMTWLCLIMLHLCFVYILIYAPIERIATLDGIIGGYFAAMTTVVLAYMGVTAWQYVSYTRNNR